MTSCQKVGRVSIGCVVSRDLFKRMNALEITTCIKEITRLHQ